MPDLIEYLELFADTPESAPEPAPESGDDPHTTALLAMLDARLKGHDDIAQAILGMLDHPEELQKLAGVEKHADKPSVPEIKQDKPWDCGPTAMAAVARSFDIDVSPDDLKADLGTTPEGGTPPEAMLNGVRHLGLQADGRERMTVEDLQQAIDDDSPVIVCVQAGKPADNKKLQAGHWVVVTDMNSGERVGRGVSSITIMDPEDGEEKKVHLQDFVRRWVDQDAGGKIYVRFGIVCSDGGEEEPVKHAEQDWRRVHKTHGDHWKWENVKTHSVAYGRDNPGKAQHGIMHRIESAFGLGKQAHSFPGMTPQQQQQQKQKQQRRQQEQQQQRQRSGSWEQIASAVGLGAKDSRYPSLPEMERRRKQLAQMPPAKKTLFHKIMDTVGEVLATRLGQTSGTFTQPMPTAPPEAAATAAKKKGLFHTIMDTIGDALVARLSQGTTFTMPMPTRKDSFAEILIDFGNVGEHQGDPMEALLNDLLAMPWEAFAEKNLIPLPEGPRGGHPMQDPVTGAISYGAPATRKTPVAPTATAPATPAAAPAAAATPAAAPPPTASESAQAPAPVPAKPQSPAQAQPTKGGILSRILGALGGGKKAAASAPAAPALPKGPLPSSEDLNKGKIEPLGGTSLHGANLAGTAGVGIVKITVGDRPYFFKPIDVSAMPVLKQIKNGVVEEVPVPPGEKGGAAKEVVASKAMAILGMAAPRAEITTVKGEKGIVCDFMEGAVDAKDANLRKVPQADVTRALLSSYLLGARDRHLGNYMVTKENRLVSIDHEFSMHEAEPDSEAFFNGVYKNGIRQHAPGNKLDSAALKSMVEAAPKLVESLKQTNPEAAAMVKRRAGHLSQLLAGPKHTTEALDAIIFHAGKAQKAQGAGGAAA